MRTPRSACMTALTLALLLAAGFVVYAQLFLGLNLNTLRRVVFTNYAYASNLDIRLGIVRSEIAQAPSSGAVLVLGDSIVEGALWPAWCGSPPLNAGVSGAGALALDDFAAGWLDRSFDAIIVATGVNDAARNRPIARTVFREALAHVLDKARAKAGKVFVATILPVEKHGVLGEAHFDNDLIAAFNQEIRSLAADRGVELIELYPLFVEQGGSAMKPGATLDGVHLTAESYRVWLGEVSRAVMAKRPCPAN